MLIAKIGSLRESNTATGFITEWQVSGDATARTITLPLVETRAEGALSYNCTIDWGDGSGTSTVTAFDDADRIHTYALDGTYEVTITGTCEGWSFNNGGDKLKITKVINFGEIGAFDGFKYLKAGFYGCTNLTSIGTTPIPASGTGVLTDGLFSMFFDCTSLTAIPTGVFDNHTSISTNGFRNVFTNCTSLTTIPTDLFRYNTSVSSVGFLGAFQNTGITTIPTDLFRYNISVSNNGFYQVFAGCTSLTTIPTDLFRYNTAVSTSGFGLAFTGCTSLTTIPTDLFRYNTAVSTFGFISTFNGCTALETVPQYLFRYNTAATGNGSFQSTFEGCIKLQLNSDIFCDEATETTTRFNNQSPDLESCFEITSFTGTQGTAPALWDYTYGTGTPTTTTCFTGHSTSSVDNYADIPTAWGGA